MLINLILMNLNLMKVWYRGRVMDIFLGECVILMFESVIYWGGNVNRRFGFIVRGKRREKMEGYIWFKVLYMNDLNRV